MRRRDAGDAQGGRCTGSPAVADRSRSIAHGHTQSSELLQPLCAGTASPSAGGHVRRPSTAPPSPRTSDGRTHRVGRRCSCCWPARCRQDRRYRLRGPQPSACRQGTASTGSALVLPVACPTDTRCSSRLCQRARQHTTATRKLNTGARNATQQWIDASGPVGFVGLFTGSQALRSAFGVQPSEQLLQRASPLSDEESWGQGLHPLRQPAAMSHFSVPEAQRTHALSPPQTPQRSAAPVPPNTPVPDGRHART